MRDKSDYLASADETNTRRGLRGVLLPLEVSVNPSYLSAVHSL
jgi:hypothetical protein